VRGWQIFAQLIPQQTTRYEVHLAIMEGVSSSLHNGMCHRYSHGFLRYAY
jgi:hypothetical protein